jgi:hypothetical protein
MTQTIDLRVRSWLIRRISGRHKIDKLTVSVDRVVLHAVIEGLHEDLAAKVKLLLAKTAEELPQGLLSEMIAANAHLSELQKAQIASILQTPSQRDNSTYLG